MDIEQGLEALTQTVELLARMQLDNENLFENTKRNTASDPYAPMSASDN